ncbi:MAG: BatA domain-containing protein [Planctomycetaceae bacterium]|nr:BatA domain-containing protein [Planctomycetaceae bacterium]
MNTISLLAFGFVSPFLLWGLLLAGVPLLIQWLHRRKYTERVWAAMRFLRAATESQNRRLRMESLLLLCVRTLILLLAAAAVAEPYLSSAMWTPRSPVATHTLILLDVSLSMQATVDGRTMSEQAREAARKLVQAGRAGDSFQLLTIASHPQAIVRQPSFSSIDVLSEIDRASLTESWGDVPLTLNVAERLLHEAPTSGRCRVVIISDFQQANWRLEDAAAQERMRTTLDRIARLGALSLIPVGVNEIDNAAVHSATVEPPLVSIGAPASILAQVHNFSSHFLRQARLQLLEEGRVLQTQTLDVPPFADAGAVFVTQWNDPGPHALQVRLEDDSLTADNDRWLAVDVRESVSVLLVNGRASTRRLEGAADFVDLALRPLLAEQPSPGLMPRWTIQPKVIGEAELSRTDFTRFDVVFLCDVPFLDDDELARLEAFVRAGGGLVIGMGDQVPLDEYTRQLGGRGEGLLPVQFVRIVDAGETPFQFGEPVARHPLTQAFAGNPRSGLTTSNTHRYVEVQLPDDSAARTVLAFSHGAPALIEHAFGAGRVVLVTTSLDDRWGSWALWPSFLPMMHELVKYVASGRTTQHALVGQSLRIDGPDPEAAGQTATLVRPDGRTSVLRPSRGEPPVEFIINDTAQSGVYRVTLDSPTGQTHVVAVNVDPRESDLRYLSDAELQSGALGATRVERPDRSLGSSAEAAITSGRADLAGGLLLAVLVLLMVEQTMAWNGRYGLVALLISPLLVAGLALAPTVALIVPAALVAILAAVRIARRNTPPTASLANRARR